MSHCVDFTFDKKMNLIDTSKRNSCWYPKFLELEDKITIPQLHMLYAESLNLAQCGFMGINYEGFHLIPEHLLVGVALFIMSILFWYVKCYTLTLLVLTSRGNNLFQHGVSQLRRFLTAERVDNKLIDNAVAHFRYWWMRTKGINIHHLTNERIGVVFRQDLNYFLYRKTFTALDTLIEGGPALERQMSSSSTQAYYLPNEEIIREMDLIDWVFIVHRGKVVLSQNGKKLQVLQRGAIFGQLDGTIPRPVRVSAQAEGYVDLLQINIKQFQELIGDEVRHNIAKNIQSANDFMAPKKYFPENPYDTVQYILRGRISIQLPWMVQPMQVRHGNLYWYWLYLAWLIAPVVSTSSVLLINAIPRKQFVDMKWFLLLLDVVHFAHFIAGFYTTELVVINNACASRRIGLRYLKSWGFYTDFFSLCVPCFSILYKDPRYHIARLLRLRYLYDFHKHFCPGFKSKVAPVILNFVIVFLLLHTMTCGWIYVACRGQFPIQVELMMPDINATIDYGQWVLPNVKSNGCARVTKSSMIDGQKIPHFVVPKNWKDDYVVALTYIIIIYTSSNIESVIPVTLKQVYYKVVINFFLHLIDMWLMSVAISFIYTKYRELYQFDYDVNNLVNFLRHGGQTPSLLDSVREYTKELWKMQRGNWLPGLAQQAPVCLREDLLGALYMHHLETPPLFRQLPRYFTRQLVARLKRIVIFPGKCIVKEGDIFPCIYFIHEGEVEKWFIDKSGEFKMQSLLTTNGYFGFIPGLFPNTPFQFSYYTRTVVDLVFLRLKDWQDLLEGYPDVKAALYTTAKQLKREVKS
ncbi:hypothetical protein K1T71_007961 [Dendrolimus kikuchii]|uniref:Uncharacterized protein n=1 Tax=Dendrolimus kikuchii TaxID=765133 RepID=A0ACC1D071_9NEOP|nr:hypothetical protein K1T71_007961 [Dendrolimus kikuchii]